MGILDDATQEQIERAVREAVPRDWTAEVDFTDGGETIVAMHTGWRRRVALYSSPGSEIAPAVIYALIAPKSLVLLPLVKEVARALRLSTAHGVDIDSWAYQLYGDFIPRRAGERDDEFRARVQCLIHCTHDGGDFHFLPTTTTGGMEAFFACLGIDVNVPPVVGDYDTLRYAGYWSNSRWCVGTAIDPLLAVENDGLTYPEMTLSSKPPKYPSHTLVLDSHAVVMFVERSEIATDDYIRALVRRAKPFGANLQVLVVNEIP